MDYCFNDKIDVKLIALFVIDSFKMPVPASYVVDTLMLQPIVNYFDLTSQLAELEKEEFVTYYIENDERFYSITERGEEALGYFSLRIPKTVRERLLRTVRLKIKELKNTLSLKAEYSKINDIEYSVSLGISEGVYDLFNLSLSVGDEIMAKKMCAQFKKDPQFLYSEILSLLIDGNV